MYGSKKENEELKEETKETDLSTSELDESVIHDIEDYDTIA